MQTQGSFLQVLSQDDIGMIHDTSLQILDQTGVLIPNRSCLELLEEAGARVDFARQRVRLAPDFVAARIALAPSTFTLYGRAPGRDVHVGSGETHFMNATTGMQILQPDGHIRKCTLADMISSIRLTESLEHLSLGHYGVHPSDLPEEVARASNVWGLLRYSTKPFIANGYGRREATSSMRLAEVVAGDSARLESRPFMFHVLNPMSPLGFDPQLLEGTVEFARRGVPVVVAPAIMAGASGPVTLAGTLALQNAEILSGIALLQLIKPHLPVFYGTASSVLDMRQAQMPYASIEASLINVATAQMARYYGIPSRGTAGTTDAHSLDMQTGFETGIAMFVASLAGLDYVHSVGLLSSTLVISFEKMVIDDEILGMIARFRKGVEVNKDTLAKDVIERVGPRGDYLAERHTVDHFRNETFLPELACRAALGSWIAEGRRTIGEIASRKVERLLASHGDPSLPPEQTRELDALMKALASQEGVSWAM